METQKGLHTILIVDDDASVRKVLRAIFTTEGYKCFEAEQASQAIAHLLQQDIDLIMCDIKMPGESGLSFIENALKTFPQTAAIMVTGIDDPVISRQAIEMGVYDYITKPIERSRVLISVTSALHRRDLETANRNYHSQLEKMVKQRTASLKNSQKELQQTLHRLRQTQTQIIHAEKMAAIGQLAAGVAHEINNPTGFVTSNLNTFKDYQDDLTSIVQAYQHLISEMKGDGGKVAVPATASTQLEKIEHLQGEVDLEFILQDSHDLIEESLQGMERIRKIVADLKDFAHPGNKEQEFADINRLLDSTLNIARNELKYKASVIREFGELPQIECYPQKLGQVFLNLLVNAAQAMETRGEIRITTQSLDDSVEIQIADTGSGIPVENLTKVFDPFFTTKAVGQGTGMGLNISYQIIQEHQGAIDVASKMGEGTVFTIALPVQRKAGEKGEEKINSDHLIVEDCTQY